MRIGVVGATGVLGRQLLPRLVERGYTVRAIVRARANSRLHQLGIEVVEGDVLEPAGLRAALVGCDGAIHAATAIPRAGHPADWSLNDRIRREGTRNFLEACELAGVSLYVQQSIALLVADGTAKMHDETALPHPTAVTRSAGDMEELVRRSRLRWIILRAGFFYGPHSGQDAFWRAAARSGQLRIPGDGDGYISLIHVADYAAAVVGAIEARLADAILNVVDDEPVTYRTLFDHIAAIEDGPRPTKSGPELWPSCRVSNRLIRSTFDWRPSYATYRSGLT